MKVIMGKTYFTVADVAEMFSVTRHTIERWAREEKLIPVKIGGRVLYTQEILQNYINKIN